MHISSPARLEPRRWLISGGKRLLTALTTAPTCSYLEDKLRYSARLCWFLRASSVSRQPYTQAARGVRGANTR
jgi:hypothetical protein